MKGEPNRGLLHKGVAVAGHHRFFPCPHTQGGLRGDGGVHRCACKERAVSGHGKAGAQNDAKKKEDGGFTYHP